MRTFQTLTQGKKSLFFPGPGPRCQAGAAGWEGGGMEAGGGTVTQLASQALGHTHTLPSFSPPQDLCVSGSISICLLSLGQDSREINE